MTASDAQVLREAPKGRDTNQRLSRKSKLRETLELQTLIADDIRDQNTKPIIRAQLVRAWDTLEERLRIIRGRTKPGSRNISVREPHPSEVKRLKSPAVTAHSSLYDYAQTEPEPVKPTDQAATSDPNGATGA